LSAPAVLSTAAQTTSSVGTYAITVSGAVSGNYAITFRSGSLVISKATPVVTWGTPADITYGPALSGAQLNASASTAGSFSYAPAAGARLNAGAGQTLFAAFTPSDLLNYNPVTLTRSLTVLRAPLAITADGKSKLVGAALPVLTATYVGFVNGENEAVLSSPVTLTTTALASSPAGTYPILASGAVGANYSISFVPGQLFVGKLTPTGTWPTPANLTYGSALSGTQLNATASVPGSFSYTPAAGTRLNAGAGYELLAKFTPSDPATYTSITLTQALTVARAALTIAADNQTNVFGNALPTLTATYSGFVNGETAAVLTTPASLATTAQGNSPAGNYPITVSGATADNYALTFSPGTLVITKATPVVTWGNPADIGYGTALSTSQLNATASRPGSFTSPWPGPWLPTTSSTSRPAC
jgi:hypothetical protein